MSLVARIRLQRNGFRLDAEFEVAGGEVVALLGPNGAGKTTVLRVLAGLVPAAGEVRLDGVDLHGVPVERRRVGLVFQDYLLFPHLSTVDNVAFGLRCQGLGRAEAHRTALEWLARMDLTGHALAKPATLSGGQAQRVALARALAVQPRLLLLDEPLAALDAGTRLTIRAGLRHHLSGFAGATVLVTHDPLDAMVLADRIVVLEAGTVVQTGTPPEITRQPRTDYVARLVGLNLYRGRAREGAVELTGGGRLSVEDPVSGNVFVAFPPAAVALYVDRPAGSPRNVWPVRVGGVERYGDRIRVQLEGAPTVVADVTPAAAAELDLAPGKGLWAAVKATETHAYPD
ncbi:MAG: ABC transporter ATP-binding protein [Actinobacteria bacterium 13_1_20CM_3_71_11]|nr:MAG: ABC transporter ATP-binding protein [Actinobacteria bacterium 13_1_20CM_3_71_11]